MKKSLASRSGPAFLRGLTWLDALEHSLCTAFNRRARCQAVRVGFRIVSRLGDGVFWYALMLALAVAGGAAGRVAAVQMALTAGVGVLLYKVLKHRLVRERPFITHADIACACPPLDRYSFPSGHTLQAVLFTTLALAWFPSLAPLLLPFTVLVALSRPILGLHYPSDVACGALLGWGLARGALALWPAGLLPL